VNVVITGASRGIGYEMAKLFVQKGHDVVGISRNISSINTLKDALSAGGSKGSLHSLQFDLMSGEYAEILVPYIQNQLERVDLLINNAGLLINKKIQDLKDDDVNTMFAVNVVAVLKLVQHLLPFMGGDNQSHIINIGSMGGYQGSSKFSGLSAYSASKGALAILSECMAEEFEQLNITSCCLALGAVNTEMLGLAFPGYEAPTDADEMAEHIVNLCDKGLKQLHGKIIPITGEEMDNPVG